MHVGVIYVVLSLRDDVFKYRWSSVLATITVSIDTLSAWAVMMCYYITDTIYYVHSRLHIT